MYFIIDWEAEGWCIDRGGECSYTTILETPTVRIRYNKTYNNELTSRETVDVKLRENWVYIIDELYANQT